MNIRKKQDDREDDLGLAVELWKMAAESTREEGEHWKHCAVLYMQKHMPLTKEEAALFKTYTNDESGG